ncbi:hypothetical protein HK096_006670, partial [Nowakowskiella sp. JEL0078]
MEAQDYASVFETCKKYGEIDESLYTEALTFFAAQATTPTAPTTANSHLTQLLAHIDAHTQLAPLQVLQILMRNPQVTVGMVRDYVVNRVTREKKTLSEDQRVIRGYRDDTAKMKERREELRTGVVSVQNTRCSGCHQGLELPAVHFACRHSFHQ